MANDKDQFKFDLDARDAAAQLNDLREKILSIGDVKNLSGLVKGLTSLAGPIAAVGAAVLAVKVAFDMSKEGEQIEKIHRQFEAFADSVGVNSKKMEENIKNSIGTTEDLDDALKSAQKAMSLLGNNSDKIPQFFAIAKQAAEAFGGTMNERFDQITQAVARGNAGMLRQIGITVDSEKALKAYAASIGTTVGALSEQGRQAAIAEAVLKKAEDRYKNVKVETEGIETSTKRFSATWKEAGDSIAVAMNKAFGPAFSKAIDYFNEALKGLSTTIKANFGDGMDKANAQLETAQRHFEYAKRQVDQLNTSMGGESIAKNTAEWKILNAELERQGKALEYQKSMTSALAEEESKRNAAANADKIIEKDKATAGSGDIDNSKKLDQANKFNGELLKIAEQRINDEMAVETNADEYRMLQVMQRNNAVAQYDLKIAETRRQGIEGEVLTKQQANEMIIQLEADKAARIEQINRDMDQAQLKVYDNQVKAANTAGQGISAAFKQGAANAQASMKNYGAQGQTVFKTLTTHAAAAFSALGEGSKSAGDAMKGFLFGSIAAIAEAQGQFLLASGIGTYNPIQIAEGGALIALAGLLRSQAGDAGGGSGGSAGGGGGGGGSVGAAPGASSLTEKPELQDEKKKAVTVQIMGNYFETEQTKTRLLEMIRENTDATDFKYQQIGVGG